jgi:hypothetical protein
VLASVDSQIVRRQRVPPATMARDILPPDFAAIDTGEVDDRRTIGTEHAPATTFYSEGAAANNAKSGALSDTHSRHPAAVVLIRAASTIGLFMRSA